MLDSHPKVNKHARQDSADVLDLPASFGAWPRSFDPEPDFDFPALEDWELEQYQLRHVGESGQ